MPLPGQSWDPGASSLTRGYIGALLCKIEKLFLRRLQNRSLGRFWPGVWFRVQLGVTPSAACNSPKASMQPRSSSSTVQPLSRSRVLAMAAGARGLDPSYTLRASHGAQFGPLSWEKWESAEAREVGWGAAQRAGTGRNGHTPCWARTELPAAAPPGLNGPAPGWCNSLVGKWTS